MGVRHGAWWYRLLTVVLWIPAVWVLWSHVGQLEGVTIADLPAAVVLLLLYAVARRYPLRIGDAGEIPTSLVFGFALLLAVPLPLAVVGATLGACIPTGEVGGTRWLRRSIEVARAALTYGTAAWVLALAQPLLGLELAPWGAAAEPLLLVLPAGLAAYLVGAVVDIGVAVGEEGVAVGTLLRDGELRQELPIHLLLVALAPAVVVVSEQSLLLAPLLLLVAIALERSSRSNAQRAHEARHDPLTGLPNRRQLEARMVRLISRSSLDDRLALLLMDLDRFKEVNDRLGHHVGDQLLAEVGARLRSIDGVDLAARIGGDEFAFILRGAGEHADLVALGERLVAEVSRPYVVADVQLSIGASIGVAIFPDHGLDAPSLLRRADAAMYDAKRSGVPVGFATVQGTPVGPGRVSLLAELEQAMARDQLKLDYQPQVDLRTGEVVAVESLLRWHHPEHGLVPPSAFVEMVEHTELILPLTRHILRVALEDAARWSVAGVRVPVAVNISARDLQDPRFPTLLAAELRDQGFRPESLTVEVTETAVQHDPQRARSVLLELRELGVKLAIDDFGTGYSSLAALRSLPFDELKIDRTFVVGMAEPAGVAIVRSVVQLAHALGMRVVAEGIEEEADLWELRRHGCDIGQGYLLSRPLPAHLVAPWVRARREELQEARGPFASAPDIAEPEQGIHAV